MNELLEILPVQAARDPHPARASSACRAEETATAVGSTTGAVRVAQHRALQRLKYEIVAAGDYANFDFGNVRGDQPALDEVAHTDLLLDALAARI